MADNRKLLIVDDDPGIRNQLKWGVDGFDVIVAEDRNNALQQLSKHHPALVTLDLGLPPDAEGIKEGFATLKAILEKAPETRVVIVSGCDDNTSAKRAVDSGAFDFFSKPVDLEELKLILDRAYQEYQKNIKY